MNKNTEGTKNTNPYGLIIANYISTTVPQGQYSLKQWMNYLTDLIHHP